MDLNLFIFGGGMYVSGRGVDGFGTVLPAVVEAAKTLNNVNLNVSIFVTNNESKSAVRKKIDGMTAALGLRKLPFDYEVFVEQDTSELKTIMRSMPADLSAAIIAIPDYLHYSYLKLCGEEGCHSLVVKPFVETQEQASLITAFFEREKLYGAVEFHKRYDESNVIARDLIQSGTIGLLSTVVVEYSQRVMIPTELFRKWVSTTNIFQYLGVHYVDQIIFAAEARPIRVSAVGVKNKLIDCGMDAYDEIIATIEFSRLGDNCFYAVFRIGWVDVNSSSAMSQQRISYYGTEGHLLLDQTNRGVELQTLGVREQINPYFSRMYGANSSGAHFSGYGITSIKSFITDVFSLHVGTVSFEELSLMRPTFEASIPSVVVTEAVGKSLEDNGAWVKV